MSEIIAGRDYGYNKKRISEVLRGLEKALTQVYYYLSEITLKGTKEILMNK